MNLALKELLYNKKKCILIKLIITLLTIAGMLLAPDSGKSSIAGKNVFQY